MKEYKITKYLIRKKNYNLFELNWLDGFYKDYFEPVNVESFENKDDAKKEFKEYYNNDDYDDNYVYHFELEEVTEEETEKILSSKPNIMYVCDNIYTEIENELIRKCHFTNNTNDDILEELILEEFSYKAYDQVQEIKVELLDEICDRLTNRKEEILGYIESRIKREFKEEFEDEKYISLIDLNDFCYNRNLESIDYKKVIEECENKDECVIAYSVSFNSDFHVYIEFDFSNYDKLKHSDEDVFYEESELKIKDIYLS